MEYDDKFMTDYFSDLFSTKKVKTVFKFDKSSYDILSIDSTKSRKIESHSSMDESHITENVSKHKPIVIYGLNQTLKKLKYDNVIIELKNMSKEDVCDIISKKEIEDNMIEFKTEILDMISVEAVSDKFVFGRKEISEAIENYMVKKLFINSKLLSVLRNKADSSLLNFTIVEIKSLQPGDPGNILNRDYFGMIAVKYY
jgi:ribosomal protein L7Ae-like RNA K-turn-binding protein